MGLVVLEVVLPAEAEALEAGNNFTIGHLYVIYRHMRSQEQEERSKITSLLGVIYFANRTKMLLVGRDAKGNLLSVESTAQAPPENGAISVVEVPDRNVLTLVADSDVVGAHEIKTILNKHTHFLLYTGPGTQGAIPMTASAMANDILEKDTVLRFSGLGDSELCALSLVNPDNRQAQLLFIMSGDPPLYDSGSALGAAFGRIASGFKDNYLTYTGSGTDTKLDRTFFNQTVSAFEINKDNGYWKKVINQANNMTSVLEALIYALAIKARGQNKNSWSSKHFLGANARVSSEEEASSLVKSALTPGQLRNINIKSGPDIPCTTENFLYLLMPNLDDPDREISEKEIKVANKVAMALLAHIGIEDHIRRDPIEIQPPIQPRDTSGRFKAQANPDSPNYPETSVSETWRDYMLTDVEANKLYNQFNKVKLFPGKADLSLAYQKSDNPRIHKIMDLLAVLHHLSHLQPRQESLGKFVSDLRDEILNERKKVTQKEGIEDVWAGWPFYNKPKGGKYYLMEKDGRITSGWYVTELMTNAAIVHNISDFKRVMVVTRDELRVMERAFEGLE